MNEVEQIKKIILTTLIRRKESMYLSDIFDQIREPHEKAWKQLITEDKITNTGKGYEVL